MSSLNWERANRRDAVRAGDTLHRAQGSVITAQWGGKCAACGKGIKKNIRALYRDGKLRCFGGCWSSVPDTSERRKRVHASRHGEGA